MTGDTYGELAGPEYTQVWDRFRQHFAFRPDMQEFPGIREPVPSLTWSLDALDDDPDETRIDRTIEVVKQSLTACTPAAGHLFGLDWQHACYRFRPHSVGSPEQPYWPVSPVPDGDYAINVSPDFSYGVFGHPWEHTLCVFGRELLDRTAAPLTAVLGAPVRQDGARLQRGER
ncbi:DUF2716 domain-containing protein [Streptomyces sp. NPDC007205]|uniref:DUF2716 domain-containing protein n=1 Tax=Streptomyces sp. NPDC007205 TaxID=3154316 RepID=UPI0033DD4574